MEFRLFFTEPWEPVVVRRGDALGLRALTDQFANELAPELSNRIRDGRWVTILAWCLVNSQSVFNASGGRLIETSVQKRERYAWLRPLELMWVARTINLSNDWQNRSLLGQRSVKPWYEAKMINDRFGMSIDQFQAYRQIGVYGGYRLAFRKWPGMTRAGDGWTPGPATLKLASWLDDKLSDVKPVWPNGISTKSAKSMRSKESKWWLQSWNTFDKKGKTSEVNTLPRPKTEYNVLPEAKILRPLIFGSDESGKCRLKIAAEIENSAASTHLDICKHLGRVFADDPVIYALPSFSRLADAGMEALDFIAVSMVGESHMSLTKIAAKKKAVSICKELRKAAEQWSKTTNPKLRYIDMANRLASAIQTERPIDCLRSLLQHHEKYAGGIHWFALQDDNVVPLTTLNPGSSRYRFRFWSLCRLAKQCGVISQMPHVLLNDNEAVMQEDINE